MNRTSPPARRKRRVSTPPPESRRRFLKLVAAGSAALLASPISSARAIAAARPSKAHNAKRALAPAVRTEIASQKGYLATTLKAIRDYPLAPGSDMAFVFRPMKPDRGASKRGSKHDQGRGK